MTINEAPATSLEDLYELFESLNVEAGWHRKAPALWAEPTKNFVPYRWNYTQVREALDAAGPLIDHSMADRRNVTLTNPIPGNTYATVRTLVGAYQMIRPGEIALAHRHTPAALRIILEGEGTYTVVQGQRVEMRTGDVLLTPSWLWHSHAHSGNSGEEDCYWVDILDVPLVHLLEPMFFERYPDGLEKDVANIDESPIAFRWTDGLQQLAQAPIAEDGMAEKSVELGDPAMPSIALYRQSMPSGFISRQCQTTANSIFTVVQGEGETEIDGEVFTWKLGDVIAIPMWRTYQHRVTQDAHLVRATDEPVMRALGLLRTKLV
jgi:gentisate 1,2-dioxygenase